MLVCLCQGNGGNFAKLGYFMAFYCFSERQRWRALFSPFSICFGTKFQHLCHKTHTKKSIRFKDVKTHTSDSVFAKAQTTNKKTLTTKQVLHMCRRVPPPLFVNCMVSQGSLLILPRKVKNDLKPCVRHLKEALESDENNRHDYRLG